MILQCEVGRRGWQGGCISCRMFLLYLLRVMMLNNWFSRWRRGVKLEHMASRLLDWNHLDYVPERRLVDYASQRGPAKVRKQML
jgi:hypothetical protein